MQDTTGYKVSLVLSCTAVDLLVLASGIADSVACLLRGEVELRGVKVAIPDLIVRQDGRQQKSWTVAVCCVLCQDFVQGQGCCGDLTEMI